MKNELKIGLVIGIAIFIFGILVITIGKANLIQKGYTFTIKFDYVSGLADGAPVMVSGMSAGSVKEISFKNKKVYVKVWIKKGIDIPSDSIITINTLGLLGEKYVEIIIGKSPSYVQDGDYLVGINPVNVSEILTRFETVVYKMERTVTILDKLMGEEEMLENLENSLRNLSKVTQDSSEIIGAHKEKLIGIIENTHIASKLLSEITKENRENIKSAVSEFKEAALGLQKTTKAIDREALSNAIQQFNKATSGISRITEGIKPDEIKKAISEFNRASAGLNEILKAISEGRGSFSKAMNGFEKIIKEIEKGSQSITEISKRLSKTAKNLEDLSADLKQHPWKLFRK